MKNRKYIFFFSFIIGLLVGVSYFLNGIMYSNYKKNSYIYMSEKYLLTRLDYDIANPTIVIENLEISNNKMKNTENNNICMVSKITIIDDYYVGYITGENNKNCQGYFYIKKNTSEIYTALTEKEIEQRFGKKIDYMNPSQFINRNGFGGNNGEDFQKLIYTSIILSVFCFIMTLTGLNIYKSVVKIIKTRAKMKQTNREQYVFNVIFLFSVTIGYFIGLFYFSNSLINKDYKQNSYIPLNNNYLLKRSDDTDLSDPTIVLVNLEAVRKYNNMQDYQIKDYNGDGVCRFISKITIIDDYYVGYITGENNKSCQGYFYIKKNTSEIYTALTEKEIEQRFGKKINYVNPSKFINRNGLGGNSNKDFEDLMVISIILLLFWSFVIGASAFILNVIIRIMEYRVGRKK